MTDLVSTHLLQRVNVLDAQVIPLELRRKPRVGVLEVDVGPATDIPNRTVRLGFVVCVLASASSVNRGIPTSRKCSRFVRRQSVVELSTKRVRQ